jgi:DeoR/GlpR family transcriptional regulator of sugar metabolism
MNLDALDRHDMIKTRVQSQGRVKIADLAAELDVSEMTIRRDLEVLAEKGRSRITSRCRAS